jgi:hypothetical protein
LPKQIWAAAFAAAALGAVLAAAAALGAIELSIPPPNASGSLTPIAYPRSHPAPARLRFGFGSPARDGTVPELAAISVSLAHRVSLDTAGIPSCSRHDVLESYEDPKPVCPRSLVGTGSVTAEITPREGAPVLISGHLRALYSDSSGFRQILAEVTTGEPLPLVYVIPFEVEQAESPGVTRLVVRRPAMHRLPGIYKEGVRLEGAYSRISSFEMSLHRVAGHGSRRHSFVNADCPLPPKSSRGQLPLLRIDLSYERYDSASGAVESTCRAR